MILFALTTTFASFDWLMSLEPRWSSTMFGVYIFSGIAVTAMAAIILVVLWLGRLQLLPAEALNSDHLYNLGGLLFTFSCFWGYIAIAQYLLIWYANLPEETVWFANRMKGGWAGWGCCCSSCGLRFLSWGC